MTNLFVDNRLSGPEFLNIAQDMRQAGIDAMGEFVPRRVETDPAKHAARNIRRKLLKRSLWPALYEATVLCWNVKTHKVQDSLVHCLLPHEMLHCMGNVSLEKLNDISGLDAHAAGLYRDVEAQLGPFIPLGLWGDGCPVQWDRSESVEVLSLPLPGQSGSLKTLRVPFTCLGHQHIAAGETFNAIVDIMRWSMEACARGGGRERGTTARSGQQRIRSARRKLASPWAWGL